MTYPLRALACLTVAALCMLPIASVHAAPDTGPANFEETRYTGGTNLFDLLVGWLGSLVSAPVAPEEQPPTGLDTQTPTSPDSSQTEDPDNKGVYIDPIGNS